MTLAAVAHLLYFDSRASKHDDETKVPEAEVIAKARADDLRDRPRKQISQSHLQCRDAVLGQRKAMQG